jgi:hypothetical protein
MSLDNTHCKLILAEGSLGRFGAKTGEEPFVLGTKGR